MVVVVTSAGAADIGLPIPSLLRVVAGLMVPISVLILPVVVTRSSLSAILDW